MAILSNYVITPSVSSNNLVVAIKTLAGANPAAGAGSVVVRIGSVDQAITSALSVTINAGANTFNSGAAELATKEIDYFVYLRYNATDGVCLGVSRIPGGTLYSDFSTTPTNEKYAAWSTAANAAAGDDCVVIGRFAATLSAGAGYTWTVPTFTSTNLLQRPVYETRWLDWVPAWTASGSLTYTSVTNTHAKYKIRNNTLEWKLKTTGTLGGSASNTLFCTAPFASTLVADSPAIGTGFTASVNGGAFITAATGLMSFQIYSAGNYATSGASIVNMLGSYAI